MLKNVFGWMFAIVTTLHFTMTHSLVDYASDGFISFIKNITSDEVLLINLKDILFRTLVMLIFMLAIYIITAIGEKMSNERAAELNKRKDIQEDYKNVVTNLYDVLLETKVGYDDNSVQLPLLANMVAKLASLYSLSPQKCEEIVDYALYNKNHQLNLTIEEGSVEAQFETLRQQTSIGSIVAKRMQLSQKCENIVRAHIEGWNNQEFQIKMLNMQNNIESQIILICDMYIALRSVKSYKRPYPHKHVIEYLEKEFKIYFNNDLFNRFIKFEKDFETMYNEYEVM
jgi:response regulator RpfG family c-di-GMP phosphodiesterase